MTWNNNKPSNVPTKLRNATLQRDGNQCTAKMSTGQRCPETTRLEADHRIPIHKGGTTTLNNLQTLCQWHHGIKTKTERTHALRNRNKHRAHPREPHPALTAARKSSTKTASN